MLASFVRIRPPFRKVLEAVALLLMTALALLVVAGVVFRKAGASLVWYDEIASILLVWLTYYGACLAALDRAHIGFPRLVESLRPGLRRPLIVLREIVTIGFFLTLAWAGFRVFRILGGTYLVSLPWLSARVTQSVIPLGAILFVIAELLSVAGISGEETPDGDDPEAGRP